MVPDSVVVTHVTAAAVSVAAINWLKNSSAFPWITQEKTRLLRVVALITAAIGAIGIHYTWDATSRVLSFDVPTLASTFGIAVAYVKSFAMQELTYQATKRPALAELANAVLAIAKLQGMNTKEIGQAGVKS